VILFVRRLPVIDSSVGNDCEEMDGLGFVWVECAGYVLHFFMTD
jgi:hypothetical protein